MKPYYDEGGIRIYHGDAREIMASGYERFDLVFTSPPYNLGAPTGGVGHGTNWRGNWSKAAAEDGIGEGYDDHDDAMYPSEYEAWQREVLSDCWQQLTLGGAIFYNHKPRVQAGGSLWLPLVLNPDLPLRQIIIWARAGGMNYAPTHYVPTHEWIMVFAKPDWRLKSKGASGVGDVWRIAQGASPDHPAPFPLGLPARAIETTGAASVLDPFMGSGTTLRAAKDAGIQAVGIEKSERYCEIAANRLGQEVLNFEEAA
jgi:site-specific DNA-methyltransferase (adenine-specific)